jgi:hypothetical protein
MIGLDPSGRMGDFELFVKTKRSKLDKE